MPRHIRQKIIAVAGESDALAAIAAIASPRFEVLKTGEARRALAWLAAHDDVAAIIAEHHLPETSGVTLLAAAQKRWPAALRILLTTFEEMSLVVNALHCGAVQHVLHKPLHGKDLLQIIQPPRPAAPPTHGRAAG